MVSGQRTFELAADLGDIDFDLTFEDASLCDLDSTTVAQSGFNSALHNQRVAGGDLASQTYFTADDEFLALRVSN